MKNMIIPHKTFVREKLICVQFDSVHLRSFDIPKFRGYLSEKYSSYNLIHNHLEDNRLRYAYPQIQFKTINNKPVIIGLGEGIEILKKVFLDIQELKINQERLQINEKSVMLREWKLGQTEEQVKYRFISPWMALNQENHKKYIHLSWHEKRSFLERILAGNLKSLAKGFQYFIPDFDNLHVQLDLKPVTRNFKNIKMTCFSGTFQTNFFIPDHLGLGKQVARGFGVVERLKEK